MILNSKIVVLIVGFRNSDDIVKCLRSLSSAESDPEFEIFIAENGGPDAAGGLLDALLSERGRCRVVESDGSAVRATGATRQYALHLGCSDGKFARRVHIAEMPENLGYAGAINAWLRPLLEKTGWEAAWILNPDTEPSSSALAELATYSKQTGKRMVGCRLVSIDHPDRVHHRGLAWRKLMSKTLAVDFHASITPDPDRVDVEKRMDAPSGASMYVTRDLINQIGLMDERYFLYFEDLEWGWRAKQNDEVGYADKSIVVHEGGTTIGSGRSRATMSKLSVYLEFRNRIMFVRENSPRWLAWTILMQILHAGIFGASGAFRNMGIAYQAIYAGVSGEVGRPDRIMNARRSVLNGSALKQHTKIAVSCVYWLGLKFMRFLKCSLGYRPERPLVVLYYHGIAANNRRPFATQMAMLAKCSNVVPADSGEEIDGRLQTVAVTFDDAYSSVFEYALPELRARQLPCTIFVPYGLLGKTADWEVDDPLDQLEMVVDETTLKQLSDPFVTIGAHSISHPHLTRMGSADARAEVGGSRTALRELIGRPVTVFSFPYGDFSEAVVEICREEGFQNAFTTVPRPVRIGTDTFVRGRISVDPRDGRLEFILKLSGAYAWMEWMSLIKRRLARYAPWRSVRTRAV